LIAGDQIADAGFERAAASAEGCHTSRRVTGTAR
jgi:hypothetical protein